MRSFRIAILLPCLALLGCASGPGNPYRVKQIRPVGCRVAQASPPPGRDERGMVACPPGSGGAINQYGRAPTPEDIKRLAGYDLTRQWLEEARREKVDEIAARFDEQVAPYAELVAEWERREMAEPDLENARAYIANRQATFIDWTDKIDEGLRLAVVEQENYRLAMANAWRGERIVWHSSRIGTGWAPEHLSIGQRGMEAEAFWGMGYTMGARYARMRSEGVPPQDAIMAVAGLAIIDLSGAINVIEAVSGAEVFTDRKLSGPERVVKGVVGVVSVATLVGLGGPRIGPFARMEKGSRLALLEADLGTFSVRYLWLIVGEAGAVLALTESEAFALAQAGLLHMSALGANGRPPPAPVPGLKGVYGKTRGGGSEKARAYQRKVTGRDDSVFVNGVEFDGWRAKLKVLLDAKFAKGKGSWYDVTGTDSFTQRFKIPEITKQAQRQVAAMAGSGARQIEWVVSDPFIAETLGKFFQQRNPAIRVVYLAP